MIIILLLLVILFLIIMAYSRIENFNENDAHLSIVDPYSLYLHKDISEKEDWWNYTNNRKLYYYRDYVNMTNKE
ncbi:hypothetical protein Indivirus_12_8 [Indivirus ILV1]|uniref:Uncharacterized protein n=1 Tax=Indivirus ILV1 TaxID=1977633 RepID=A0A1V0SEC7_9VIRU|nr:hypothetical protein Indivirus_12_8 [Indivirus ILV1]